jgi:hypothetical protein
MNKRILVLLSVVAPMMVMLAMSVAPALAYAQFTCTNPNTGEVVTTPGSGKHFAKRDGFTECHKI